MEFTQNMRVNLGALIELIISTQSSKHLTSHMKMIIWKRAVEEKALYVSQHLSVRK
jgi:hypothetical protein